MDRLGALTEAGVSIWLDTLSRELLLSGEFARLVAGSHVTGATSNPTIFAEAITGSDCYDEQLRGLLTEGIREPRELFFALALDDVRSAADALADVHRRTEGRDGFVSFEVARTVDADPKSDARVLTEAARDGVDLERLAAELEREGVRSFCDAYQKLLDCIASRSEQMGVG